jgi:methylenetetrahydrofolate--tRNA-(uracil-5-)-methyltransferase
MKAELQALGSPLIAAAYESRVPGGKALSVDRETFSNAVKTKIDAEKNIEVVVEVVNELPAEIPTLIATGPLTGGDLITKILNLCGDKGLYFYDATSPIVALDSLEMSHFFWGNRNQDGDDYLNLPLNKEQYRQFRDQIMAAEKVESHLPGEDIQYFEGCLPIEELARRGEDTLAFSCMRPIGFQRQLEKRAYAVIQFRREKAAGNLLNMVGFQTRMKWPEQQRVFRALPGMESAEFVRLGAMHRNTFINAPLHLDDRLRLKHAPHLSMAGQITGSEGYSEAIATGHYAALQMLGYEALPETTSLRSLVRYLVTSDARYFQPMNFNFGLLPTLSDSSILSKKDKMKIEGDKATRNLKKSERALRDLDEWLKNSGTTLKNFSSKKACSLDLAPRPIEPESLISNA